MKTLGRTLLILAAAAVVAGISWAVVHYGGFSSEMGGEMRGERPAMVAIEGTSATEDATATEGTTGVAARPAGFEGGRPEGGPGGGGSMQVVSNFVQMSVIIVAVAAVVWGMEWLRKRRLHRPRPALEHTGP